MGDKEVELRFYEELNDFLPRERRKKSFRHRFFGARSVKDLVESLGVPHTEIDVILVDGESVGFERRLTGASASLSIRRSRGSTCRASPGFGPSPFANRSSSPTCIWES